MGTDPTLAPSAAALLAVFAHPDDESVACGGLLARCSEAGIRSSLLCLTRGANGPGRDGGALGDVRAAELADAARVLGIADVVLLDHEDGMLPWTDAPSLEADIVRAVRRFEPEVVVTFDQDGLYSHPDHVAVHERVTSAVAGLGPGAPALYYVSMPEGAIRAIVDAAEVDPACADAASKAVLGIEAVDAFGWGAPTPTMVVEAGSCAARKLAAIRCHRTQVEGTALDCVDEGVAAGRLATEHYRRAEVGRAGSTFLDRLGAPAAAGTAGG